MPGTFYDISRALNISSEMGVFPNTDDEIKKVKRVIAGARACSGPEEAKMVLEMLGVLPTEKGEGNAGSSGVHGDPYTVSDGQVD
jgi:hypothetical protein